MDFDIVDDIKPRFQLRSEPLNNAEEQSSKDVDKVLIIICMSTAVLLVGLSWFLTGVLQFLTLWLALSLGLGPFAPSAFTGGDCRVGQGELLPEVESVVVTPAETERRPKLGSRRSDASVAKVSSTDNLQTPVEVESNGNHLEGSSTDVAEKEPQRNGKDGNSKGKSDWTEAQDKALVLALKTFRKDTPMRWDKIAVAVPGRSKAQCFKRFSELREGFRKARNENNPGGDLGLE